MATLDGLRVKLYADRADLAAKQELAGLPYVAGFTTNATLMGQPAWRTMCSLPIPASEASPSSPSWVRSAAAPARSRTT